MLRNANAISCVYFLQPVLLACLLHKYAQSGGALRNSVACVQSFVASCSLVFICRTCQTRPHSLHVVADSTMELFRDFPVEELHASGILSRASTNSLKEDFVNVNSRIDILHKDLMSKYNIFWISITPSRAKKMRRHQRLTQLVLIAISLHSTVQVFQRSLKHLPALLVMQRQLQQIFLKQ